MINKRLETNDELHYRQKVKKDLKAECIRTGQDWLQEGHIPLPLLEGNPGARRAYISTAHWQKASTPEILNYYSSLLLHEHHELRLVIADTYERQ